MDQIKSIVGQPWVREAAFIFAILLLLGGVKFGIEASVGE